MLENITIGQYVPGNSMLHALDARSKILGILMYMISLFLLKDLISYTGIALFTVLLILISQVPIGYVLKGLRPLAIIIIFTFILHIFFTPGEVITKLGPFSITREGFYQGILMSARLLLLILGTSLLTLTTSPINLTDGIEGLLKPATRFGFPAHELAMMMSIALRFIPTFAEETDKILKAQKARGADLDSGSMIKRVKNMVSILVPLFVSAFRRADELAVAMEARCYRGGENRTSMREHKFMLGDYLALSVMSIFLVLSILNRLI